MDRMERILLVFPETRYPSGQPPLGLGILAALAEEEGRTVRIFDMSFM